MPVPTAEPPRPSSRSSSALARIAVFGAADCARVSCELLSEAHGDGVLHVRASGLQDVVKLFALLLAAAETSESRTG